MSYREELAKQVFDHYFRGIKHYDNFRPSWLEKLELDRFYPDMGVGIEFQGEQHYRPVPGMHKDEEAFRRQVSNDTIKRQIMNRFGYQLYAIDMLNLDEFKIKALMQRIANDGLHFASAKGYTQTVARLNAIRHDQPLPRELNDRVNKLSYQKNRQYWGKQKKQSGFMKLLKAIFWPDRK
jgi:hypothetical protein